MEAAPGNRGRLFMQCFKPISIKVKNDQPHGVGMTVPCGKCLGCRIARRREWMVRIMHELDSFKQVGVFLTLTYNNKSLPPSASLDKEQLKKFWKRLRKYYNGKKIKYYACGEYGDEGRPHYHAIVFGIELDELEIYLVNKKMVSKVIERLWKFGFNQVGTVTTDSASYVAGYIEKKLTGEMAYNAYYQIGKIPPYSVMSKGIGEDFALKNQEQIREALGITIKGKNVGLPRYYRKLLDLPADQIMALGDEKRERIHERFREVYEKGGLGLVDMTKVEIRKYRYYVAQQKCAKRQGEPSELLNLGLKAPSKPRSG